MNRPNDGQWSILHWDDHIEPILKHRDIHIRDKAIVAVAWESIAPLPVLRGVRFDHVADRGEFMTVTLTDRNGTIQHFILQRSMPYLRKWLQEHPVTKQLDADATPLEEAAPNTLVWTQTRRNQQLSFNQIQRIIERVCERAGVTKEVTLHNMRRSRVKLLGQN
jgi:site-specific recombinase XerC